MAEAPLITAVIPAYNPNRYVLDAVASVEAQTWDRWECIVVDDGSTGADAQGYLKTIEERGDERIRVLRQPNRGTPAARNTGFREAAGEYVVPLDADDLLEPEMMAASFDRLQKAPEAGYCYFDYRVFGERNYLEEPGEYDFYRLLNENYLASCSLFRRAAWERVGGYDEELRWSYEDWSFFIALGKHGLHGVYLPKPLYRYRTEGRGLHYEGLERHEANWERMVETHPEVLSPEGRLRVKRAWSPAVCLVAQGGAAPDLSNQTLQDFQILVDVTPQQALERSRADAFLWLEGARRLRPQALEECVWGLQSADWLTWRDTGDAPPPSMASEAGPLGLTRQALGWPEPKESGEVRRLPWRCRGPRGGVHVRPEALEPAAGVQAPPPAPPAGAPRFLERIARHLHNAEVLSAEAWLKHPATSAARLIPLRVKEAVNRRAGQRIFDLSFYLKFQPRSVLVGDSVVEQLDYIVPRGDRARLALFTPHLGYGGAETVLYELTRTIDRERFEVLLIATHSNDARMKGEWLEAVDWIWDAGKLVPPEGLQRFLVSLALNWQLDAVLVQNTAAAYGVLPALKQKRPELVAADLLHAVDENWDFFSATLEVSDHLDRRVVISEAGRRRLEEMAVPPERIRLIPNGVDLTRFHPGRVDRKKARESYRVKPDAKAVAYVGRLDAIKRPLLTVAVARELTRLQPDLRFQFLVAGDGPENERLHNRVSDRGLSDRFRLLGHVARPETVLAAADVLLIPSAGEGVPLVLLEALALGRPVVACRAGAIEEALPADCGVLVEPGPGEQERLAEALADLLGDDGKRLEMGRAAQAFVERRHSLDRARQGYRALLEELTQEIDR